MVAELPGRSEYGLTSGSTSIIYSDISSMGFLRDGLQSWIGLIAWILAEPFIERGSGHWIRYDLDQPLLW